MNMKWTELNIKKHKGITLPQLMFKDPDYFFWACEKSVFKGQMQYEAKLIYQRSIAIRIPSQNESPVFVAYIVDEPSGKFGTLQIVTQEIVPFISKRWEVKDVIDMSYPRRMAHYDKKGYKNFLQAMNGILFGKKGYITKAKCEEFFNKDDNFKLS